MINREQVKLIEQYQAMARSLECMRSLVLEKLFKKGDRVRLAGEPSAKVCIVLESRLSADGFGIRLCGYDETEDTWLNGLVFEAI